MKTDKSAVEFVQWLKDKGIPRSEIADHIYGASVGEIDEVKQRREKRIAAVAKVYAKS
jgi:hypothetical protein